MREFRRQPDTRAQGRVGEEAAEAWMVAHGYRIVQRNFTCRSGEIDRVAEHDGTLCFVEIKARAGKGFGSAVEAVPPSKQRKIARAAAFYLTKFPTELPCRFDVLAMDLENGEWRFTWVPDAFRLA